jgi:hypothetical protein
MFGLSADVRLDTIGFAVLIVSLVVPSVGAAGQIRCLLVLPRILLFGLVIVLLGVVAELIFFLTMINALCAVVITWVGAACGTYHTLREATTAAFRQTLRYADSWAPFFVTGAAAFAYLALLCVAIPGTGSVLSSVNAWLGTPIDNFLPHLLASHIATHAPPKPFSGDWLSSDRPPLQAGFDLLYAAVTPFANDSEPRYEALSVLLQASSIGLLYTLCRLSGCRGLRSAGIALIVWFSGFFFVNTLFVWPKLVAAAYLAVAVSVFLSPGELTWRRAVLIGISVALGFLSHSAVVFAMPCLALAWLIKKRLQFLAPFFAAVLAGTILLAPWTWYQNIYDPPGNRLIKWYLAGQITVNSDSSLLALHRAYADTPPLTIAYYKLLNFVPPLGVNSTILTLTRSRDREFFFVRDALGALFIPYLSALFFFRSKRRTLRTASRLAWIALGSIVFWCLAIYLPAYTVVHVGSYFTMLLMYLSGAIVATEWIAALIFVASYQVYDFATSWLPTVDFRNVATAGGFYGGVTLMSVIYACVAVLRRHAFDDLVVRGRSLARCSFGKLLRYEIIAQWRGLSTLLAVILVIVPTMAQLRRLVISVPDVSFSDSVPESASISPPVIFGVARIPRLSRIRRSAVLSLDAIKVAGHLHGAGSLSEPTIFRVGPTESINLYGWAFDPLTKRPAGGLAIRVNGHDMSASYGYLRPDVAQVYSSAKLSAVGFHANLNARSLGRGVNVVSIVVVSSDRTSYYLNPTVLRLDKKDW